MRFRSKAFEKISCEPRFADARFAGNQHDLTLAALRPRPAPQQQLGFFLAPDEGSQTARMQCLEAARRGTRAQRRPRPRRPGEALEVPRPEVLEFKEIAEKSTRAVADDDHVRLGNLLQPRREIRRLANDAALLRLPPADEIADDDQPGRNSDTGLQESARFELGHRFDSFEPRPYGPLGVVLMGSGIAKIHEGTVAHVSRHETIEAVHGLGNAFLIG